MGRLTVPLQSFMRIFEVRWSARFLAVAGIVFLASLHLVPTPRDAAATPVSKANRLINSGSPYLLQHAHNPVDWYPWGEAAFKKARAENKPVFLSVGYSTCYWCHVAERTIYADPAIAKLMNKWFVNVKVDREERPDVDEIYMLARQVLSGSGGWPNNLFLTPDLKPFFAGSYFPPKDHPGQMGFPTLLKNIHGEWKNNPSNIAAIADNVHATLMRVAGQGLGASRSFRIQPKKLRSQARGQIMSLYDSFEGGFSGTNAAKFPQSPLLKFLIADYRLSFDKAALSGVDVTLRAIAFGGINDHIGGGVHRYSTEPSWSIPHFEKMLFDNAQLIDIFTAYYEQKRAPFAAAMVSSIADYLQSHMTAPGGGFYTAEDADIDGVEGESYLWLRKEISGILGDVDAQRFFSVYELTALPEEPGGGGVLRVRKDLAADASGRDRLLKMIVELGPSVKKLREIRDKRRQPLRDDKIVVSLNGFAIAALARAGKTFGRPDWIDAASRAAEFLWREAYNKKTRKLNRYLFKGKAWGDGFLEDYASLALGFLALDEVQQDGKARLWRGRAVSLASVIETRFMSADGVTVTRTGETRLIVPAIDLQDGDTPSGTSLAYELLSRLGRNEPRFAQAADRLMNWMAPKITSSPDSWVGFLYGLASAEFISRDQSSADGVHEVPAQNAIDSAPHVKVSAVGSRHDKGDEVAVTLNIEKGYHINGNPASLDFLMPTRVILPGTIKARISYPVAFEFKTRFVDDGIMVYEGEVVIKVETARGLRSALKKSSLKIEVQACTEKVCLEPSVISVPVKFD